MSRVEYRFSLRSDVFIAFEMGLVPLKLTKLTNPRIETHCINLYMIKRKVSTNQLKVF